MTDSDLQALRRQARQRFVGAAVLVLLAIIILPFVLDTKPRPVAANITIEMQAPAAAVMVAPVASAPVPVPAVAPAPQIAPEPAQAATEVPTKPDDGARAAALLNGAGYLIQAGSFTDKTKVVAIQTQLEKAGFQSFTQDAVAKDGTAHTRIRLGPFATQAEANNVSARIGKLGIKTIVIKP
jgi:DedD protein